MIIVRDAVAQDAHAVAQVHVRSWQVGYRGILPQEYLDALRPEDRARNYAFGAPNRAGAWTQVAVDGETLCGHITTGPCRDDDLRGGGEIWAIYVDPLRWGTGVGRLLLTAGCERLRSAGHDTASLWVLSGNTRGRRFYELAGWRHDGAERADVIGDCDVMHVRYRKCLGGTDSAS